MNSSIQIFKKAAWALFFAATLTIASCSKTENESVIPQDETSVTLKSAIISPVPVVTYSSFVGACGSQSQSLVAGQNYTAGSVIISNSADKIYVSVSTQDGWALKTVHLYVGDKTSLPVNKSGNPVPGSFPVNNSFASYQTTVTYEFNTADFSSCFVVALHAEVSKLNEIGQVLQSETAWAAGTKFVTKGSWATYASYCVQTCTIPPPTSTNECTSWAHETAFGGNTYGTGNAWWYYYDGAGAQTIWAGQSQNAGTVELKNGSLYITLANGWELEPETTESVKIQGYNTPPTSRPAAGQFTTYKGTSLTVSVGTFTYYVIHLDVRKCNSSN